MRQGYLLLQFPGLKAPGGVLLANAVKTGFVAM
jgi:hypothetical protein